MSESRSGHHIRQRTKRKLDELTKDEVKAIEGACLIFILGLMGICYWLLGFDIH